MALLQWNCNGIFAHLGELQNLVANTDPQYICIQESRLHKHQSVTLKGYNTYRKDRQNTLNASGGVAIFTKEQNYVEELNLQTDLEAIAIRTHIPNISQVTICNLYLPPNANITHADMNSLVKQLPSPFILVGDFNGNNILWGSNRTDTRGKVIERLIDDDIILLNDSSFTHLCTRTGNFSCIDLSLCDSILASSLTWNVLPYPYGSDHFPIKIDFPQKNDPISLTSQIKWKLNTANWELFSQLAKIDIPYNSEESINLIVNNLTSHIITAAKEAIGQKKITKQKKVTSWWNPECQRAIKENKCALYKYRKNQSTDNLIHLKKCRAIARRTILASKKKSWQEYVETINTSTPIQKVWDKIRKIRGTGKIYQTSSLIKGARIITSPQEIADTLADTFQYNSSNNHYDQNFTKYKNIVEHEPVNIQNCDSPINNTFTKDELIFAIKDLKDNRSPGPDGIPFEMIKHLPEETLNYLLELYNHIWKNNIYPDQWKQVITIPILKPNKDKTNPNSYRPISMSNSLNKVLQKMVNKRLSWYLEANGILTNIQSGFRNGRSTTDNIIALDSEIQKAFRNKQHLIAIFFDVEKAYDTTWKDYILKSLKKYGLDGNIIHYIRNFLTDRRFKVRTNGCLSEEKVQVNGVPQGEILSVILFLLAINDIVTYISQVRASLFADDLVIHHKGKNLKTIQAQLQAIITKLEEWCKKTGFKLSSIKTKAVHFSKLRRSNQNPVLKLKNDNIEYVSEIKFLGMTFDRKLTWRNHIQNLKKECSYRLNIIKTLGHQIWGAQREILLKIYYTLIRSKLDYGCISYGNAKQSILKMIDPIQNSAIRISTGAFKTSPINSVLCESGHMPLKYRRTFLTLSYVSKLSSNSNIPTYHQIFQTINNETIIQNIIPLHQKIKECLDRLHINFPNLENKSFSAIPPWICRKPNYNLKLTKYQKNVTSSEKYQKLFDEIKTKYQHYHHIYTDGSKIEGKTGAAMIIGEEEFKYHLPDAATVHTAEAYSILMATEYIKESYANQKKFAIYTDSTSVIGNIKKIYQNNATITKIQENIHHAVNNKKEIVFIWVPSHRGISGNEKADRAAKEAITESEMQVPIPPRDFKGLVKHKIKEDWETHWRHIENNHLRNIKTDTGYWQTLDKRRDQIILTRLRIGHTLMTHKHILQKTEAELCDTCNTRLTVEHLIIDCHKYTRQRHDNNIPNNLKDALSNNIDKTKNTLKYLQDINAINLI